MGREVGARLVTSLVTREPLHKWLAAANRDPSAIDGGAEAEVRCEAAISRYAVGLRPLRSRRLAILARNPLVQRFPRGPDEC
jgi:hypothetical protein